MHKLPDEFESMDGGTGLEREAAKKTKVITTYKGPGNCREP